MVLSFDDNTIKISNDLNLKNFSILGSHKDLINTLSFIDNETNCRVYLRFKFSCKNVFWFMCGANVKTIQNVKLFKIKNFYPTSKERG